MTISDSLPSTSPRACSPSRPTCRAGCAFDLAFFAALAPRAVPADRAGIATLAAFALLSAPYSGSGSASARADDPLRSPPLLPRVFAIQFVGWLFHFTAFFLLLEAFNVGGSVRDVLLVLGVDVDRRAGALHARRRRRPAALLVKVVGGPRRRRRGRLLGRAAVRHRRRSRFGVGFARS